MDTSVVLRSTRSRRKFDLRGTSMSCVPLLRRKGANCLSLGGKKAGPWLGLVLASFLFCLPLFSQTSQGTIQGAVLDQSGGAIAGAMVTVTDVARGIARNLVADGAGQYVAVDVNPGTYTVRAEA